MLSFEILVWFWILYSSKNVPAADLKGGETQKEKKLGHLWVPKIASNVIDVQNQIEHLFEMLDFYKCRTPEAQNRTDLNCRL